MLILLAWLLGGYLVGSLPTGVLVGRLAGRDPRTAGSGNIGASNVARTLGRRWGALVLGVDLAKGALPTLVAAQLGGLEAACAAGTAAVIGHCYPVWLRFNGGKGVATAFGVLLVLAPVIAAICGVVWIGAVLLTRTPAIGSLIAIGLLVALPYVDDRPFPVHVFAVVTAVVVLVRHRSNLQALREGQRRRARRVLRRRKGQGVKRAKAAQQRQARRRRAPAAVSRR